MKKAILVFPMLAWGVLSGCRPTAKDYTDTVEASARDNAAIRDKQEQTSESTTDQNASSGELPAGDPTWTGVKAMVSKYETFEKGK